MKSKIIKLILAVVLPIMLIVPIVSAQENFSIKNKSDKEVNLYFFWANGCPHCAHEEEFLKKLQQKYSGLEIHYLEVTQNKENLELLKKVGQELNANISGVPFTVIGEQYFSGYSEQTTGAAIEEAVKCAIRDGCFDTVGNLISPAASDSKLSEKNKMPEKINVPFLGEMETKNLSLPALTVIIGVLDGFNPCAMWVLIFLISLLLGMEDRKRMWLLGSIFIASSAFVYFLFMSAWLNLILFLGFIVWVRIAIGLTALIGGGYNLKEYFTNKEAACKVTSGNKRQKTFGKLKDITQQEKLWLAIGGIILLAFAVNLVELICSAGLPAVYVQILTLTNLPAWQYYAYLVLYIFFFMLDDLIVFFAAMKTLQITGVTTKYTRASHLIGGIIMLIIGILLIFKPGLLMFG